MLMTPIMQQYLLVKQQHQDCIVFFRLGDFYEMFYEDAQIAADILGITLTKRVQKDETIPMAGVPYHTSDHYIAKLVRAGKKIALCEQIETPDNKSAKIIDRQVVRIITPGTLTDDNLLTAKRNNFLLAIHEHGIMISCAVFDLSTNQFFIESFESALLKDFLEKIEPSEILLFQDFLPQFHEYETWKNIITLIPEITNKTAQQKTQQFYHLHSTESLAYQANEMIAIAMILEYIQMTQKASIATISMPTRKPNTQELQMDKFTRRNLEITKTLQNTHYGSLLWLLDETKTAQGGRALFQCLNCPARDINILNERYEQIAYFLKDRNRLQKIREILKEVPDFERMLSKLTFKRSSPMELRNLAIGINNFLYLAQLVDQSIKSKHAIIDKILNAINEDATKEKDYIKHGYDTELDSWKAFEKEVDNQILALQEEYKTSMKIPNLRIKFNGIFGYVIEINSAHKDKLSYAFLFRQDLKNVARYTTQALENINLKLAESTEFIILREEEIFNQLVQEILAIADDINIYAQQSAQIDLYANFAIIASENGYVRPEITNDKAFEITEGRHPVLDKIMRNKGEVFVTNNCNLNKCVMFMTGPNMAGKSTYLRQQALIVLLAHVGMYVPAQHAKIGIVDHIFSRIGAGDNLVEGNSTFMMEMIEIALTLNQATSKSFIVFDEVGRGTSVEEGMAIAQAILEHLTTTLAARALFATHYLALAKIEHINLQKKMMEIMQDPIYFTHKLLDGVAKKSYAIQVAQLAGMPNQIVKRAEEILQEDK